MPMLKVRCAKCTAVIPTGSEMSYEAFRNATFQTHTVRCPQCGAMQKWTPDDVDMSVFKDKK